jgi:predicted RNA-binding Zn-ribbon protein involved in translation (DUF1610 family)
MNKKTRTRPQYGLQIKRIRKILGNERTEWLIDAYVEQKKQEYLDRYDYEECPKCGLAYSGYPATSRRDNETEICSQCGVVEAFEDLIDHMKETKKGGE